MRWQDLVPILVDIVIRVITLNQRKGRPRKAPRQYPGEE